MRWIGKILCCILGAWLAGLLGMIVGLIVGHWLDEYYFTVADRKRKTALLHIMFSVLGHMAKVDGRISPAEIQQARQVIAQLNLSKAGSYQAIRCFYEGKNPNYDLQDALQQLRGMCAPSWLNFFMAMQVKMAFADGYLHPRKKQTLDFMAQKLGISWRVHIQEENLHTHQQSHTWHAKPHQPPDPLLQAYQLLGISYQASHSEIKKAYRRAMTLYHPDKLMAKGLSEADILQATQKTQQIRAAYESICESRGI
ncbi:MAG: co-chaperone DjlA [Gammaproteobacteria bacterium]